MYSFNHMVFIVRSHMSCGITIFEYYDLLWRILFFFNKIIIMDNAKLQYVPWNAWFCWSVVMAHGSVFCMVTHSTCHSTHLNSIQSNFFCIGYYNTTKLLFVPVKVNLCRVTACESAREARRHATGTMPGTCGTPTTGTRA
jgi:hypothetical protein